MLKDFRDKDSATDVESASLFALGIKVSIWGVETVPTAAVRGNVVPEQLSDIPIILTIDYFHINTSRLWPGEG